MSDSASNPPDIRVFDLWMKYEEIAMHFNGLIMRLRTQALAGVAAIATLITVLGRLGEPPKPHWGLAAAGFFFLLIFWIAIWILDFRYYTRLLVGAVSALICLEKRSVSETHVSEINISTLIENSVDNAKYKHKITPEERKKRNRLAAGRWWFYGLVFFALFIAFVISLVQLCRAA